MVDKALCMEAVSTIWFDFVGVLLVPDLRIVCPPLVDAIDDRIGAVVDDEQFQREAQRDFALDAQQFQAVLKQVVQKYRPYLPLWERLPALKRRFRLGVINNGTWLTYPRFNQRFCLEKTFDCFVSSAVEGVRKPDPQIYLRACERLGVRPEHCLFLDDAEENVAGAERVGMQGMHWKTPEEGFARFERL